MKHAQTLTPEERARITEIQDLLIGCFVEHKEAIESGRVGRAKELERTIEQLQLEKENVEMWATLGSA